MDTPPPVQAGARLRAYATADDTVVYVNKSLLYVDGKLLGRVPNLAIYQRLDSEEVELFFCDEHWELLGVAAFASIDEARKRAESEYHGISSKWIDANVSDQEALCYETEQWQDERCSFCGRIPPEIKQMIASSKARICDICITEFFKDLQEND